MIRVVAFNGSARKDGNTAILLNLALDELKGEGIETEMIQLAGETLSGCIACYKCAENKNQKCAVTKDRMNEYISKMQGAHGILLGSPTYISDMTANMKALVERATITSRSNGDLFKRKVGAAVISVRRAGSTHVLSSINYFFLINQMIIPGSRAVCLKRSPEPKVVQGKALLKSRRRRDAPQTQCSLDLSISLRPRRPRTQ
jgi:multimeric flavodoxin WrbA